MFTDRRTEQMMQVIAKTCSLREKQSDWCKWLLKHFHWKTNRANDASDCHDVFTERQTEQIIQVTCSLCKWHVH